jgi:hypothetical protein
LYFKLHYFSFSKCGRNIIWSSLEKLVVWVTVFQSKILLVSSGGCLKMDAVCLFRTVSIPDDLVCVCRRTQFQCFSVSNDVMKWRGDGVWYGIVVLEA